MGYKPIGFISYRDRVVKRQVGRWWLRSPGNNDNNAANVNNNGALNHNGNNVNNNNNAVRPASPYRLMYISGEIYPLKPKASLHKAKELYSVSCMEL